ncbi:MAG: hypothetical protein EOM64_06890 [Erysipelotrichia bacterium]|nr:hypothetical protein [Erysipelotrichia bacterium]
MKENGFIFTEDTELTPEQWIGLVECYAEGLSAERCARQINTSSESAAYWYDCIKEAFANRYIGGIRTGAAA